MESNLLITIAITCHREGEWLRECWDSVLAQSDQRWEAILVMDGGSDQATRDVFESLVHRRLRKVVLPDNVGWRAARNRTIALVRTPYYFYLDGDDRLLPRCVSRVLDAFAQHPEADVIYGDYRLFGGVEGEMRFPGQFWFDSRGFHGQVPGAAGYRTALFGDIGGFEASLCVRADLDFYLRALEYGARFFHIDDFIYEYRKQSTSVSWVNAGNVHEVNRELVVRHPRVFASDDVKRRFLTAGYEQSFAALSSRRQFRKARSVAREALKLGFAGRSKARMKRLTLVPIQLYCGLSYLRQVVRQLAVWR